MEFESASAGAPPYGIPVHPALTTVEPLPPGAAFPALAATEQPLVSRWITQDLAHLALAKERRAQKESQLAQIATGIRENQDWLGRPLLPLASTSILTESRRALVRGSGKSSKSRPQLKLSAISPLCPSSLLTIQHTAPKPNSVRSPTKRSLSSPFASISSMRPRFSTTLLPGIYEVSLANSTSASSIDAGYATETVLTPEIFAAHLCEDLRLPLNPFYRDVVEQIKRGIEEGNSASYDAHLGEGIEEARIANRNWFQDRAKRRKLPHEIAGAGDFVEMFHSPSSMPRDDSTTRVAHVEEGKNEDLRVLIRVSPPLSLDATSTDSTRAQLDITLDTVQLVDKFEWDISNAINSPEEFAEIFSSDLGLSGEFKLVQSPLDDAADSNSSLSFAEPPSRTPSGSKSTSSPGHSFSSVTSAVFPSPTMICRANSSLHFRRQFDTTPANLPPSSSNYQRRSSIGTTKKEIARCEGSVDKRKVVESLFPIEIPCERTAPFSRLHPYLAWLRYPMATPR